MNVYPPERRRWREVLLALGASNFLHLPLWHVLRGPAYNYYFPSSTALFLHVCDVAIEIAIFALLFYCLVAMSWGNRSTKKDIVNLCINISILVSVSTGCWSSLVVLSPSLFERTDMILILAIGSAMAGFMAACAYFSWVRTMVENTLILSLVVMPLSVWQILQAGERMPANTVKTLDDIFYETSQSRDTTPKPGSSMVWIVFDELDQSLTFERPLTKLPNFERLRRESFYATSVSPSHYRTNVAMPSMLTGHLFTDQSATAVNRGNGLNNGYWENRPTILSELRARGESVAVSGWYNPYCAALNHIAQACFTGQTGDGRIESYLREEAWPKRIGQNLSTILKYTPLLRPLLVLSGARAEFGKQERDGPFGRLFELEHRQFKPFLLAPYNFVLLHLSVPHLPGIKKLGSNSFGGDYADNLEIADHTLGEIRSLLEQSGRWNQTTVLVTGDHHLRTFLWGPQLSPRVRSATEGKETPRTVFLLKTSGSTHAGTYVKPFNAVLIHDLLLALDHDQNMNIAGWIDANRSRFPSPDGPIRGVLDR